jgi:YesN/AraC family two-component response regulator
MKILLVNDEMDVTYLFEQYIRKEIRSLEMEFMFAFSGEHAFNYLQVYSHETVLILSDINMPGMSGLQLLRMIKETYESPKPHVMMMAAYGDDENYRLAMKYGADDFLTKPVDFPALKEKLNKVANS